MKRMGMIARELLRGTKPKANWVPPKLNNVQFTKWLKTISDKRLKQLVGFIYNEGRRRGWDQWWME